MQGFLKGPQGTLFGRNSTGGAITTTTKKPGQDFETSIAVGYGDYDDLKTRIYTNIPLSEDFAFNVSALYNQGQLLRTPLARSACRRGQGRTPEAPSVAPRPTEPAAVSPLRVIFTDGASLVIEHAPQAVVLSVLDRLLAR